MDANVKRVIIAAIVLAPLILAGALYTQLVLEGTLPTPSLQDFGQAVAPVVTGSLSFAVGLAVVVIVACAAIAPVLYAARSGDVLTVLVSLVLTTMAIAVFVTAKSAIQEILAVLIYLANTTLSATVYAARHIARSLR